MAANYKRKYWDEEGAPYLVFGYYDIPDDFERTQEPDVSGEQMLWAAVIQQAIADTRYGDHYQKQVAHAFLMGSLHQDFKMVCDYAGLSPSTVTSLYERSHYAR